MNRIQELIKELCPNGVEWKKLGEIGTFVRGNGLQKSDFTEYGFPCIHYGQIHTYYGLSTKETKSFCSNELASKLKKANTGDLIIATTSEDVEACCKATVWLGEGEVAISGDSFIYHHNQNPLYIAYMFGTELFAKQKRIVASGAKVVRVSGDAMAKFEIPLPPLSVQTEIVRILDKFLEQQEQLEKLIELRTKQYEYYREEMLTAKEGEEWETKTLGECCKYSKERISYNELNTFNYVSVENLLQNKEGKVNSMSVPTYGNWIKFDKGDVLIGNIRPYLRKIWHSNILGGTNGDVLVIKINNKNILSDRFLYYILSSERFFKYDIINSDGAKMPRGNKNAIMKYIFSFPSLESQSKIVKTLDSFESSISALTSALELSKKRYEHYRDEMLRF